VPLDAGEIAALAERMTPTEYVDGIRALQQKNRGREAAQRIRARADREVVEIRAAAQREAEILRGQGDAERSAIYADAYQRDPEFFDFYRSMSAYATSLEGNGTSMVLSPNSEFFRYFGAGKSDMAEPETQAPGSGEPAASGATGATR
jgi:membrane protease subunit HflC